MALLEIENLKKHFQTPAGTVHAVDGISFTIEQGKTLGIVGESGCGKTTLGRTVLRLIEPTSGDIRYNGESILKYKNKQENIIRREMQLIFQDPYSSLNPRMTVFDLIAEPIRVQKTVSGRRKIEDKVFELMEQAGLAVRLADAYPHELDGGRRQRVGIARALSLNPKFIVCDEPVSALDVSIQAQILNKLMDLQEQFGLTYLFITHNLSVVKHISDDIMVMYLGQCVEKASSSELFKNPMHPYTKMLLAAIPVPRLRKGHQQRQVIRGEVTSPIDPKPGCRFASRCPNAGPSCTKANLPLVEVSPGHFVSCMLFRKP